MANPSVTIGIISCNRLHYLRPLIESARICIEYDNLEWIVVDNASIEEGLREYVDSLSFVQIKKFRERRSPSTEHLEAMNYIIERSSSDYVMLLSDDLQFIVRGGWMRDLVEFAETYPNLGTVIFDAQRRSTLNELFPANRNLRQKLTGSGKWNRYQVSSGSEFFGYGKQKAGIAGAGINTFTRKATWQRLGPWRATGSQTVADSTGGGEDDMLARFEKSGLSWERCITRIPMAASIITDERGTRARIRGNRRYGEYWAPPSGDFYYQILDQAALQESHLNSDPVPFEEIVKPLGYSLPLHKSGNLIKDPHQSASDPFEWIHPSVEGVDLT